MNRIVIFDWGGVILKEYPEHYCDQDAIKETIKKFNTNLTDDEAYDIYLETLKDENEKIISIYDDYENNNVGNGTARCKYNIVTMLQINKICSWSKSITNTHHYLQISA